MRKTGWGGGGGTFRVLKEMGVVGGWGSDLVLGDVGTIFPEIVEESVNDNHSGGG